MISLEKRNPRKWTEKEVDLLIYFVKGTDGKTLEEFSTKINRTESAVISKLEKLRKENTNLPFIRNYSIEEIDFLNSFINDQELDSIDDVATYLGRSYKSVESMMGRIRKTNKGVKYQKKPWTEHENSIIKHAYRTTTNKELAELLGRSESSIAQRARVLGISKKAINFTEVGETIKQLALEGYTKTQIAEKTNINYTAVHNYIYRNNIACKKSSRRKTIEQKKAHYEFLSHAFGRY